MLWWFSVFLNGFNGWLFLINHTSIFTFLQVPCIKGIVHLKLKIVHADKQWLSEVNFRWRNNKFIKKEGDERVKVTSSLQSMHWWTSDEMFYFSKSDLMKKRTHLHLEWPEAEYIIIFGWTVPFTRRAFS